MCHKPHMTSTVWGWGGSCILYIWSCDNRSYEEGIRVVQKCPEHFSLIVGQKHSNYMIYSLKDHKIPHSRVSVGQWKPCKPEGVCRPVEMCHKMLTEEQNWKHWAVVTCKIDETMKVAFTAAFFSTVWKYSDQKFQLHCLNKVIRLKAAFVCIV